MTILLKSERATAGQTKVVDMDATGGHEEAMPCMTLEGSTSRVTMPFNPGRGTRVIVGDRDGVRVWDVPHGKSFTVSVLS